jgi:L-ribulose-5-phosphate 4-epimerase
LTPADIVIVDLGGKQVEGKLRPSSDTATHQRLFQTFEGIRSVVHSHSRHATSFAQAGKAIPCFGTTHADYFRGEVPVTRPMTRKEVEGAYERETGNVIIERFKDLNPLEMPGVLVHGHGPFAWGPSGAKAVENALALEIVAEMALNTLQLNLKAPTLAQYLVDKHFLRKHGDDAYYGQKS